MRKLVVAVVLGLTAVAAWAQGTAKPGVITVGFIPAEDSRAMVRQSQAILDIVAKHTGMKVDTFVGSDYNATIEALRAGHIDVALLGNRRCPGAHGREAPPGDREVAPLPVHPQVDQQRSVGPRPEGAHQVVGGPGRDDQVVQLVARRGSQEGRRSGTPAEHCELGVGLPAGLHTDFFQHLSHCL